MFLTFKSILMHIIPSLSWEIYRQLFNLGGICASEIITL